MVPSDVIYDLQCMKDKKAPTFVGAIIVIYYLTMQGT